MKASLASLFAMFLFAATASAQTPSPETQVPPSEVSVRQLLEVMQTKKLFDGMSQRMDAAFTSTVNKMLEGETITPERQQAIDAARTRVGNMMKEVFNWEALEPIYLKVYTESFSQSEIDAMTAFYRTSAGQAVAAKLPLVTQRSAALLQERMLSMLPKMQQVAKETAEQVKKQHGAASKSAS